MCLCIYILYITFFKKVNVQTEIKCVLYSASKKIFTFMKSGDQKLKLNIEKCFAVCFFQYNQNLKYFRFH